MRGPQLGSKLTKQPIALAEHKRHHSALLKERALMCGFFTSPNFGV